MKWLVLRIPVAILLLCFLGYVMQCFLLGGIPMPHPDITPNYANFFMAHIGSGVGKLTPGLLVALIARLALRKHQITALIIVILVSVSVGFLAKTGDLSRALGQEAQWHPHAIACGFGYAAVMAAFWLGMKGLWRFGRRPASELPVPMASTGAKESA